MKLVHKSTPTSQLVTGITTAKYALLLYYYAGVVVSDSINHHITSVAQQQKQEERMERKLMDTPITDFALSGNNELEMTKQLMNEFGETEVWAADGFDTTLHFGAKLWNCQGDCDSDSDCFGTMKCLQRYGNEPVPGCFGYEDQKYYAYDFCYDPLFAPNRISDYDKKEYGTLTITKPVDSIDESLLLDKCQGHCTSDADCNGSNLKCMFRDNTMYGANYPVPGCTGIRVFTEFINYCYDPNDSVASFYSHPENVNICLYQDDFEHGTVIIRSPGIYTICEDIQFCPNVPSHYDIRMPDTAYDPVFPSDYYDEYAFSLGFHSAIVIIADNVVLDLNTYTIRQCESFALMQRFFSIIELSLHPFINNTGPANFVGPAPEFEQFESGNNITIKGPGTLGRSSHNGIHGNYNKDITIKDVIFEDFEIAAVGLNRVENLLIENCEIKRNRQNVPVLGKFSAARYIRPYVKYLMGLNYTMKLKNEDVNATGLFTDLITAINTVYNDVLGLGVIDEVLHPELKELFENPYQVIDGPCYAFVVHGDGPAINGFGATLPSSLNHTSTNVTIRNNKINNIKCFNNEIPAAVENGTVVMDVRGSTFQFYNTLTNAGITLNETDGTYIRNILADCQIMVAKAILDGMFDSVQDDPMLLTFKNSIPAEIVTWAEGIPTGSPPNPPTYEPKYRCNGDAMHHVAKGMVVIRVEQTCGFSIENNTIEEIVNLSTLPFEDCTDYHALADPENSNQTQIAFIRGISIAGSRAYLNGSQSLIKNNIIANFVSENSPFIVGIDIQGDTCGVDIMDNVVDLDPDAHYNQTDAYVALIIGENADSEGMNNTITIRSNTFMHEQLIQNLKTSRGLRNHVHQHKRRIGEWKISAHGLSEKELRNIGGCPLGYH